MYMYSIQTLLFCCSDVGNNDLFVIQELIKTVAQVNQLETASQKDFKGTVPVSKE